MNALSKFIRFFCILMIVALMSSTMLSAPLSSRHRFHTSLTRIDYNPGTQLFEISIQLFTHDLTPLLEQRTNQRIDLEKTPDVDKFIFDYLNENFVLTDQKENVKKLNWVGKEMDVDSIWIYVETPSAESIEGFNLRNTLFFESFQEQTNLVICRFDNKKADLMYKVGDQIKEILPNKEAAEN